MIFFLLRSISLLVCLKQTTIMSRKHNINSPRILFDAKSSIYRIGYTKPHVTAATSTGSLPHAGRIYPWACLHMKFSLATVCPVRWSWFSPSEQSVFTWSDASWQETLNTRDWKAKHIEMVICFQHGPPGIGRHFSFRPYCWKIELEVVDNSHVECRMSSLMLIHLLQSIPMQYL